jgi:hypothetical protein
VLHSCLVEDTALFLRHILERLTREKQDEMFAILRRLLRFVAYLPQQTAFTLHNYLIGYIMFYVRTPMEGSQDLVGNALSLLSMVRILKFKKKDGKMLNLIQICLIGGAECSGFVV